MEAAKMLDKR